MKKSISVADLVMGAGGVVTLLFSLFKFIGVGGFGNSAWGSGNFPIATIPAILGLAMVAVVVAELLGQKLPGPGLTFNWAQVKVTWGIVSAAIMLAFLVVDKGGAGLKFGGFMMLIGSAAMCAGSIMAILGKGTDQVAIPGGAGTPSTPTPPPAGGTPPPPPPPPPPAG